MHLMVDSYVKIAKQEDYLCMGKLYGWNLAIIDGGRLVYAIRMKFLKM